MISFEAVILGDLCEFFVFYVSMDYIVEYKAFEKYTIAREKKILLRTTN